MTKHGHTSSRSAPTPTYQSWQHTKDRCTNPRSARFSDYGGRGIAVCDRWRDSFENFLVDMGERPPGTSIDRFPDNDGNYEPGNCRWATDLEQQRNRRNTTLSPAAVALVLDMRQRGVGTKDIAHALCVPSSTVNSLLAAEKSRGALVPALPTKSHCGRGHLLEGWNLRIRPDGGRFCRACRAVRDGKAAA